MRYAEYIRSEKWRAVRKWALERAEHRCQVCNVAGQLHVHHRTYTNLGHEMPGDVIVLCGSCHELFHFPHDGPLVEQVERMISSLSPSTMNDERDVPWIHRVNELLKQIKHRPRRLALAHRIVTTLEEMGL